MDQLQQFFKNNRENLIEIFVKEKLKNGYGAVTLTFLNIN